jgi:hypothetical protein
MFRGRIGAVFSKEIDAKLLDDPAGRFGRWQAGQLPSPSPT